MSAGHNIDSVIDVEINVIAIATLSTMLDRGVFETKRSTNKEAAQRTSCCSLYIQFVRSLYTRGLRSSLQALLLGDRLIEDRRYCTFSHWYIVFESRLDFILNIRKACANIARQRALNDVCMVRVSIETAANCVVCLKCL